MNRECIRAAIVCAMLATALAVVSVARAELPAIIPREVLFGNPERTRPTISPDGKRLAWIAPDATGVVQVWVQSIATHDARAVTADRSRGIGSYDWTWDSHTILFPQDFAGDENFHLFAVNLADGKVRDLTPSQGVRAELVATNPKFPDRILVAMNLRNRKTMDVYRIDLKSGATELDTTNPGDVAEWLADDDMVIRAVRVFTSEGGHEIRVRDSAEAKWHSIAKTGAGELKQDMIGLVDFSKDGRSIFLASSVGGDTFALVSRSLSTGIETVLARRGDSDLSDTIIHPMRHEVEAAAFSTERKHWQIIDASVRADFEALAKVDDGDLSIVSRDRADDLWLVQFVSDRHSDRYYLWDRHAHQATLWFSAQPRLDGATLAPMKPFIFRARDGMDLHAYLTLPPGVEPRNLPLVETVHGGPWSRFSWRMDESAQWFANRGYAVLQVNYRGSAGYGKKYLHAGDRQWGLAMQDDLTDSVKWAVASGIADPKRVAIDGGSYGGYAALAGAAFTPELYRCAIDVCGPSNLFTLIKTFPAYYGIRGLLLSRVGDPDNPADRELLTRASPLFSADQIRIPMLIGQGANDPRVTRVESEAIVAAIAKNHGNATYVVYSDEGHGLVRPANLLDFAAREEKFLARELGGRYEPMTDERMLGSTAVVKVVGTESGRSAASQPSSSLP